MARGVNTEYLVYAIAMSSPILGGKIRLEGLDDISVDAFEFFQRLVGNGYEQTVKEVEAHLNIANEFVPEINHDISSTLKSWLDILSVTIDSSTMAIEEFYDALVELTDLSRTLYLSELEILIRKEESFTDGQRKYLIALGIALIGSAVGDISFNKKLFTLLNLFDIKQAIVNGDADKLEFYKSIGISLDVFDSFSIKMIGAASAVAQAVESEDLEPNKKVEDKKKKDKRTKTYSEEEVQKILRLNSISG